MLALYQFITIIIFPFVYIYLFIRKQKGKEDGKRFNERFGKANLARPKGTLIWIHAASVGEALSILPLVKRLLDENSNLYIMVTTVTLNSANMMATRLPDRAFHQYIPVDNTIFVESFLRHWHPDLALWVESELWPCLLQKASKRCPVLLINARMSDRSYARWGRARRFSKAMLSCFSEILTQSKQDEFRYQDLGANPVTCIGNLKYDAAPLPVDSDKLASVEKMLAGRLVWVAASTHDDEELRLSRVHTALRAKHPSVLTIIVPRHPKRKEEIIQQLSGVHLVCRSDEKAITKDTDIYLADTMGELGIFYRITPIVFMGGTLIPHGGQNPLEPARLNSAIIFGPHMENFREIEQEFLQQNAAIHVEDEAELITVVDTLLVNEQRCTELANSAAALVKEKNGVMDTLVGHIEPLIVPQSR